MTGLTPCAACGQHLSDDANACTRCGKKTPRAKRQRDMIIALVVFAVLACGAISLVMVSSRYVDDANRAHQINAR